MTTEQTPKAKLTDDQIIELMHQISKIHATLNDMFHMISVIQNDRQSEHDDSFEAIYAEYEDLDKIWDAIRFGQKKINEMKEMIWDVIE